MKLKKSEEICTSVYIFVQINKYILQKIEIEKKVTLQHSLLIITCKSTLIMEIYFSSDAFPLLEHWKKAEFPSHQIPHPGNRARQLTQHMTRTQEQVQRSTKIEEMKNKLPEALMTKNNSLCSLSSTHILMNLQAPFYLAHL